MLHRAYPIQMTVIFVALLQSVHRKSAAAKKKNDQSVGQKRRVICILSTDKQKTSFALKLQKKKKRYSVEKSSKFFF